MLGKFMCSTVSLNSCFVWALLEVVYGELSELSEMRCWRRMEKIGGTDRVKNGEILLKVTE